MNKSFLVSKSIYIFFKLKYTAKLKFDKLSSKIIISIYIIDYFYFKIYYLKSTKSKLLYFFSAINS